MKMHEYYRIKFVMSRGRKFSLALIAFLAFSNLALSQISQPHRFEREQKGSDEYYTIISLKEEGLALLRILDKYDGGKRKSELVLLDTALNEKGVIEFDVEQRNSMLGYEYIAGNLVLLYRQGENAKKFLFLNFDLASRTETARIEINPELEFKITHFSKVNNHVVLGGYVSDDPAVILFNLLDKQIKVLPGFFQKDTELVDVRVNQNNTFNTIITDRTDRAARKLLFKTFDEEGNVLLETGAPIGDDIVLQTSISSTLEREDLIVLGTWGQRAGRQSSGFFAWPVDPFKEQQIEYTYFGQLEGFFDYMNPKRARRIKEKTKQDIQDNKRPDFSTYVVPFRIVEHKDGFLMLAEVYDPQSSSPYYANPYYNNPAFYGSGISPYWPGYYPGMRMYRAPYMYGSNVKNSDQIKTYSSAVLAFDSKGKLLWDYSLKLDDMTSAALEQEADFHYDGETLTILYKKESELILKRFSIESDQSQENKIKVTVTDPLDEIRHETEQEGGILHWEGNSFYMWGYQTIRNTTKEDKVRDIFYINKVVVH
jgi:hypothetical protein